MKKLILTKTYYQLIVAIQLKLTLFKADEVDLYFFDSSNDSENIVFRIKSEKLFESVYYIKTGETEKSKNPIKKLKSVNDYVFKIMDKENIKEYDEMLYYNATLPLVGICNACREKGYKFKLSRFEEGLLSYENEYSTGNTVKILDTLYKIKGNPSVIYNVSDYYCFFPELKNKSNSLNVIKIPPIVDTQTKMKKILTRVFDCKPFAYKQKYIFFASCSDIDGWSFGETELVLKIADKVGKENLLVKMHPRDNRDVYSRYGIDVMKETAPWEVVQLCNDLKDRMLLTITSGSFVSISTLMNMNIEARFLFDDALTKNEILGERIDTITAMLNKLHDLDICNNLKIIKSL